MVREKKKELVKINIVYLFLFSFIFYLNGDYKIVLERKIDNTYGTKKIDLLNELSIKYQEDEDYENAKKKAESALKLAKKINYNEGSGLAENSIGHIFYVQENYKKAILFFNYSLNSLEKSNNLLIIVDGLQFLGMSHYMLDNYNEASSFLNKSLKIYKKQNNRLKAAEILSMLGDISHNSGNFDGALRDFFNSLRVFEDIKNKDGISNTLISIGGVYISNNKFKEAEKNLQRAYNISSKRKNKMVMIDALSMLGMLYRKNNNFSLALNKYKIAYKLAKQENDKYQMAGIQNNIGDLKRYCRDFPGALKSYREGYYIFKKLNNTFGTTVCSVNIGLVHLNEGKPELALPYFKEGMIIAKSLDVKSLARDIYKGYSDAFFSLKKFELALKYYKLFTSVKDKLFTEKSSKNMADMQTKYETEKKEHKIILLSKDKNLNDVIKNSLYIVLGLLLILAFLILNRYRLKKKAHRNLTDAHEKLEIASDEISGKNEKIISSIRYAQRIQNAILPLDNKISEAFPENFLIFLPKDIVSGDFYWFSEIDNIKFITVVDCTGHGVPGAFMSMIGNSLLNQIINEQRVMDPAIILDQLSLQVKQALKQEKGEGNTRDGMDMCFCKIEPYMMDDPDLVKVTYCGAKRSLYIVKKGSAGNDNELIEIKGDRKSIGGYQKKEKAPFKNNEILLTKGDSIYMTSDGFVDQHSLEDKKFGSKKLRSLLMEIASYSMEKQKDILQTSLKKHKNSAEQQDDITILGIKF